MTIFRVSANVGLPVVDVLADGSFTSVVYPPTLRSRGGRERVLTAARAGADLDPATQEIWGMLLTHYALCALAFRAAHAAQLDPDRVSFVRTLRIARRCATGTAGFPP